MSLSDDVEVAMTRRQVGFAAVPNSQLGKVVRQSYRGPIQSHHELGLVRLKISSVSKYPREEPEQYETHIMPT